jgi:hypothetical protein
MQIEECVFVWCNPLSANATLPPVTSATASSLFEDDKSSGEVCNDSRLLNSGVNACSTPGNAQGIVDSTVLPLIKTSCPQPLTQPLNEVPRVQAYTHLSCCFPPDNSVSNFLISSSPVGTISGDGVIVLDLPQCYQQVQQYQKQQQCQPRQYQEQLQQEPTIPSQLSPSSSFPEKQKQVSPTSSEQGVNGHVSILESERFSSAANHKLPAADYDILFFEFLNNTEVHARLYRETHLQPKTLAELRGKMYFLHVGRKVRKRPKVGFPFRCSTDSHYTSCNRYYPVICKVKEWRSPTENGKVWRLYHFYCGKVKTKCSSESTHSSNDDSGDEQRHAPKRQCTAVNSEKVSTPPSPSPSTLIVTQPSKERPPPFPPSLSSPSLDQSETHP